MGALKTVFRRIGGRIIPIRVSTALHVQDDFINIMEIQRARKLTRAAGSKLDKVGAVFLKTAKLRAKETGLSIAKRISRFKVKGIL